MNSMSYVDKKALFCQCMLLSVNGHGIARKEMLSLD